MAPVYGYALALLPGCGKMQSQDRLIRGGIMYWFRIEQTLQPTEREPAAGECAAVLLSSAELERKPSLSGLESVLHHTPTARGVRVCKAELRRDCVSGTLLIPQSWKDGRALACGYLITKDRVVLVDDTRRAAVAPAAYFQGKTLDRQQHRPLRVCLSGAAHGKGSASP